jgi:hypothetical protein
MLTIGDRGAARTTRQRPLLETGIITESVAAFGVRAYKEAEAVFWTASSTARYCW